MVVSEQGGKERNKHSSKKLRQCRGPVGKNVVAAARDPESGQISAAVLPDTTKRELHGWRMKRRSTRTTSSPTMGCRTATWYGTASAST